MTSISSPLPWGLSLLHLVTMTYEMHQSKKVKIMAEIGLPEDCSFLTVMIQKQVEMEGVPNRCDFCGFFMGHAAHQSILSMICSVERCHTSVDSHKLREVSHIFHVHHAYHAILDLPLCTCALPQVILCFVRWSTPSTALEVRWQEFQR